MLPQLVYDLLIILASGLCAGLVCRRFGISVLVGYLVIGALIGESSFAWITDKQHEVEYIAEAGIFLLLFSIGLEFSLEELLELGRDLAIGGSVQMLLVAVPIAVLMLLVGAEWRPAALIAVSMSFSSTVLVFKALSEWGQTGLPHGRRAVGILLFQDAALIPLLLVIPLLTDTGAATQVSDFLWTGLKSLVFIISVVVVRRVLARWAIPMLANYRSPDVIVLFTLVSLGGMTAAAFWFGLPEAIGAFAAGLIFSGNRWTQQVDALILPFRESFAAVFFVSLGLLADISLIWERPFAMFFSLLGLFVVKATAATVALRLTKLRWFGAFGMGLGLAHVGEFAFVLVLLGMEQGILTLEQYQQFVTLAIGSLILTPLLLKMGLRYAHDDAEHPGETNSPTRVVSHEPQAVVIGAGPVGRQVASRLELAGKDVCIVDVSPLNLQGFSQQGFRTIAGDATHREILELADVDQASIVIVCVSDDEAAILITQEVRTANPECLLLVRCRYHNTEVKLLKAGAEKVISEEAKASEAMMDIMGDLL